MTVPTSIPALPIGARFEVARGDPVFDVGPAGAGGVAGRAGGPAGVGRDVPQQPEGLRLFSPYVDTARHRAARMNPAQFTTA
jgi:hypothetical protein